MMNISRLRKSFVKQQDENDCGIACLAMILNYTGRITYSIKIRTNTEIGQDPVSLFTLKELAAKFGLSSNCVKMELSYLDNIKSPCILHLINQTGDGHFQVIYGLKKIGKHKCYLMADPATNIHYLTEDELKKLWTTRAALYFSELKHESKTYKLTGWSGLLKISNFPKALWIIIPLLTICTTLFGISLTWVLQRGLNNPLIFEKTNLIIAISILLFTISIFRSLFSYLRQIILININNSVNKNLMKSFFQQINGIHRRTHINTRSLVKAGLINIRSIQTAMSVLLSTLLSESALILICLFGIGYITLYALLINCTYISLLAVLIFRAKWRILYNNAKLKDLSSVRDKCLTNYLNEQITPKTESYNPKSKYHMIQSALLDFSKNHSFKMGKLTLLMEIFGTANVITVFVLGVIQIREQLFDYNTFMIVVILTFIITNILPKVCNALFTYWEGTDAYLRNKTLLPETDVPD